ncbi:MAG: type I restriction-modification system subunit M [Micavibrio sp.]|nr:type I restriction-modification system subunit M [Micavibrio sp.]|tara:strand:- start:228 stop:2396 length:2169 start_codon:yes stop_codon:yes gene_type:complete
MTEEQKQKLEAQLWKIANELRGKMGADEFRDYILGFIFYKYLSEKQYLFANKLLETENVKDYALVTDKDDLEAIKEETLEKLGYFLAPHELFGALTEKGNIKIDEEDEDATDNFILEDLQSILNAIEQSTMGNESEDDFNKLFEDIDLASTKLGRSPAARNTLIAKVLAHLDAVDFRLDEIESDVLGDAYEYLIAQFASGAGKKAGEFYTPSQVSKILSKIVTLGKGQIKNAYDPACGSGSLLLRIGRETKVGEFFGQELNRTTYNLCRMNMILHDVHFSRFDIKQEDTLEEPQHEGMEFEAIVANPPFSAQWKGKDNPLNETDDRFSQYGALPPSSKADFAFVQHIIHQLADNGTGAIVLPHGVLFRGGAEGIIREYIIKEQNYLDAVIGLPPNIFYGTSIPACILVFKKCRKHDDDILFIDASADFEKDGNKNKLTDDNVTKIIEAYTKRESVDKYAYTAPLSEIAENDYNLNILRYVDTSEEEEQIDLDALAGKLIKFEDAKVKVDESISNFCQILNIPEPAGTNLYLLRLFKKGCMQKLFSQEIRFTDDKGKPFPEWKEKKLGDVLTIGSGRDYKHLADGDVPVYGTGGYMTSVNEWLYDGESVCIGRKGTIDQPRFLTGKFWTVDTLFFTHSFKSAIPKFIYYVFLSIDWQKYNEASGVPSLSKKTIEQIKTMMPHPDEQKKIADFLSAIDDKIALISEELDKAKTFKKGLLQQMFV